MNKALALGVRARDAFRGNRTGTGSAAPVAETNHEAVNFGDLRSLQPVDRYFGYSRGTPVDRWYIERFLQRHRRYVHGRTLEVKSLDYTRQFGSWRITRPDIVDIDRSNRRATIIADLGEPGSLPAETFDCIILTQTLQLIPNVDVAVDNVWHALKPGGTLLLSVPGISKTDDSCPWYWLFTEHSVRRLLQERFAARHINVESAGNVLAATAFLQGIAAEELQADELAFRDDDYTVSIMARAART